MIFELINDYILSKLYFLECQKMQEMLGKTGFCAHPRLRSGHKFAASKHSQSVWGHCSVRNMFTFALSSMTVCPHLRQLHPIAEYLGSSPRLALSQLSTNVHGRTRWWLKYLRVHHSQGKHSWALCPWFQPDTHSATVLAHILVRKQSMDGLSLSIKKHRF